jgi:hypothetical protein
MLGSDVGADDPAAEDDLAFFVPMAGDYSRLCDAAQRH